MKVSLLSRMISEEPVQSEEVPFFGSDQARWFSEGEKLLPRENNAARKNLSKFVQFVQAVQPLSCV